jgi:hypothetical protein
MFQGDTTEDELLAAFICKHACALKKDVMSDYKLANPSLTTSFFKALPEKRIERLSVLAVKKPLIEQVLVTAMSCSSSIHFPLLAQLYKQNPTSQLWDFIRFKASSFSVFIRLLTSVWLLDTLALFEKHSSVDDESLPEQLGKLFDSFVFPGKADYSVEGFARKFLLYANSLNSSQIQAFALGLMKESANFVDKGYDYYFINKVLKLSSSLPELATNESVSILLKEYVVLNASSSSLEDIIFGMKTKEQMKTFILGLNSVPEPWRTLHLRILFFNSEVAPSVSCDQIKEVFAECQLDYFDYPPIHIDYYNKAFLYGFQDYFNKLQEIDNKEILIEFLECLNCKAHLFQALAGGIKISEKVIIKHNLDDKTVEDQFNEHGLKFDNHPITIEAFLKPEIERFNK